MGTYANKLFIKILKSGATILFSDSLVWELKRDYSENDVLLMLGFLSSTGKLIKLEIMKDEFLEAKQLCSERNLPKIDCLNSVQARNHNAILVSQDKHILINLSDIVKTKRPEDLI